MAGDARDEATAKYVAQKFRDAPDIDTRIVEYQVWITLIRLEISVDITAPWSRNARPRGEHVDGRCLRRRPRV